MHQRSAPKHASDNWCTRRKSLTGGLARRQCTAPVTTPSDSRSPLARAYQWATRIMVVSLEMVLPGLAGYWIDQQLGSLPVLMLIGFAFGGTAAVVHLIHLTRREP
jgi:F0F1-type ATP synthase assembly protein I